MGGGVVGWGVGLGEDVILNKSAPLHAKKLRHVCASVSALVPTLVPTLAQYITLVRVM